MCYYSNYTTLSNLEIENAADFSGMHYKLLACLVCVLYHYLHEEITHLFHFITLRLYLYLNDIIANQFLQILLYSVL